MRARKRLDRREGKDEGMKWKSAVAAASILAVAGACFAGDILLAGPFSVMDKTITPPSGDKHDYMSLGS